MAAPAGGGPPRRPGGAARAAVPALAAVLTLAAAACGGNGGEPESGAGTPEEEPEAPDAAGEQASPEMTEVDRFLSFAAADSLVELELYAGFGGANSAWNFNGYHDGNATYVVPLGWRVRVTYETLDANVPHSAAVVEPTEEIPADGSGVRQAFSGASTPSFVSGISSSRDAVTFRFRADEPGRYWIFCGVAGHALEGMWMWLEVSEEAEEPAVREEPEAGEDAGD